MVRNSVSTSDQLLELVLRKENRKCAECHTLGPRWASCNLGVFLCIRCAGAHRMLGVHVSRVKSVALDSWTNEQVATMREMGNEKAARIYEGKLPTNFERPQNDGSLQAFVRDKYERKRWYKPLSSECENDEMPTQEELLKDVDSLLDDCDTSANNNNSNQVNNNILDEILPQSVLTPIKTNHHSAPKITCADVSSIMQLYNRKSS